MFGAGGNESPSGAPVPNKTVMFGAPGNEAPAAGNNRTMMFGAGAHDAPAPAAAPHAPPPNKTVMFGAPGNEASAAGGSSKHTMMFGAPAADAPGPGTSNKTAIFGAPGNEAAAGGAAPNKTMMFGAPGGETAGGAPANKTMMFGAPGAESPSGGAPASKTMMFGSPADAGGPPQGVPRSTMMFGAQPTNPLGEGPAHPPPPRTSNTMMFGAPNASPPASAPAPKSTSSTMMFGTPAAAPPPAVAPQQPAAKSSNTMMFGTRAPVDHGPAPQKTSGTMIFGTGPAVPAAAPAPKGAKLSESTVRIGPEDLERMMREHEGLQNRGDVTTPTDGQPAAEPKAHQKTQMFAMGEPPDGATPPAGNESIARQNKTQMFAMSDIEQPAPEPAPQPPGQVPPQRERRIRATATPAAQPRITDPSTLDTFPPGQQRPHDSDLNQTVLNNDGPSPLATLMGDGGPPSTGDEPAARVELPPEEPALLSGNSTQPMAAVEADPAAVLRAQVARRNRIALIIIALVLVGAALAVTWKVFGRRLLSRAPPAAAVEGCDQALSKLRYDDSKSKAEAVALLKDLTAKYPDFIEGHAALVTALSLQLDDVQQRVRRIEQLVDKHNTRIARYNKEHAPSNWEILAQTLSAQVTELIGTHKPLAEQGQALDSQARQAYKGLELAVTRVGDPTKPARLAALRAQALFHGVSGGEEALKLTSRYEQSAEGQPPDGWIDLAIPEYAANARVSDELKKQARAKLEELHKRDATFLRTYVLQARLALSDKDVEGATTALDQVLSMQKDHDVAIELRDWIRKQGRDEKKEPAP
jgi:hypothetical protein